MKSFERSKQDGATGPLGEDIALKYLLSRGFGLICRNYRQKWGEIDLIVSNKEGLHFVEVKAVSCEINKGSAEEISRITKAYMPEERVHDQKSKRIFRTIQSYIVEKNIEGDWTFDVAAVFIDPASRKALVRYLNNVIVE
jgi:putative endonuclease